MKLENNIICLIFISLIAGLNCSLLFENYADYGISKFFSLVISTIGIAPAVVILFFPSGVKLVGLTKGLALIAFGTHAYVDDLRLFWSSTFRVIYFYLNIALLVLCIASMIVLFRKIRFANRANKGEQTNKQSI